MRKVAAARCPRRSIWIGWAVACSVVVMAATTGVAVSATNPGRDKQSKDVPRGVERLWSQYPLNPKARGGVQPQPQSTDPTRAELREPSAASRDAAGTSNAIVLAVTVAVLGSLALAFLLLFRRDRLVAAASGFRGELQPRLALPSFDRRGSPRGGAPDHPSTQGGQLMSYFRRLRQSDGDDEGRKDDASAGTQDSTTEKFAPYSLGGSAAAESESSERSSQRRVTDTPAGSAHPTPPASDPEVRGGDSYEQVGEHVTAVLSSAHEAADRLRAAAAEEADYIRGEADEYAGKARAAADAYAEERRESAETKAAAIVSEAENRARSFREAARKDAEDIQREAIQRREALLEESERSEERLRNLLQVFRTMTERLENLVGGESDRTRDTDRSIAYVRPETAREANLADTLTAEARATESRSDAASSGVQQTHGEYADREPEHDRA